MKSCERTLRRGAGSVIIHMGIILVLSFILCMAFGDDGLRGFVYADSGEDGSWSEKKYYHLDMGVQLAYQKGNAAGDVIYASANPVKVSSTISFNEAYKRIKVEDVYPLESEKGRRFDFNASESSMNIADGAADKRAYYESKYRDYVSLGISNVSHSSSGLDVSFSHMCLAKSRVKLDVVDYGKNHEEDKIFELFCGENALRENQPRIYQAVCAALDAGRKNEANVNRLYLIFCPMVIEYRIAAPENGIEACLDLPLQSFVGDEYKAKDVSHVSKNSYVVGAALSFRRIDSGNEDFSEIALWKGDPGKLGRNTGGIFVDKKAEAGIYEYKLSVENNFGKRSTDVRKIRIVEKSEVSVEARLGLPDVTYVGHEVIAADSSQYTKDGEKFDSFDAYRMNLGSGSFSVSPDDVEISDFETNRSKLRFNRPGVYTVTLTARTTSGLEDTDSKDILVKDVPDVNLRIGGLQKQNRRQVVSADLIYDPRDEIKEYKLEMTDETSGEKAILDAENPHHIGSCIKTRDVKFTKLKKADGFAEISLEFLTKKPDLSENGRDFECRVSLLLKSGRTAEKVIRFNVIPDSPPKAEIAVKERYIRNENSNIADILVEDVSISDGDKLKRFWTYDGRDVFSLQGSRDYSFGAKKKISFQKEGVGKLDMGLEVVDDFIEDTLPEFISEADFLRDRTTAVSEVDNIAPVVGVDLQKAVQSEISVVAEKKFEDELVSKFGSMEIALKDEGIDPHIHYIPTGEINAGPTKRLGEKHLINGMNCVSGSNIISTEDTWYSAVCEEQLNGTACTGKHRIDANSVRDGKMQWSYNPPDSEKMRMFADAKGKYLVAVLTDKKQSLLLDAHSGDLLAKLEFALPCAQHYVSDDGMRLYFLDSDGISALHMKHDGNHKFTKLKSDTILWHGLMNGKITYVAKRNFVMPIELKKVTFSPETEEYNEISLPKVNFGENPSNNDYFSFRQTNLSVADMDIRGNILLALTLNKPHGWESIRQCVFFCITPDGEILQIDPSNGINQDRDAYCIFVKDETGTARYIAESEKIERGNKARKRLYIHGMSAKAAGMSKMVYEGSCDPHAHAALIGARISQDTGEIVVLNKGSSIFGESHLGFVACLNEKDLKSAAPCRADISWQRDDKSFDFPGRYEILTKVIAPNNNSRMVGYSRKLDAVQAYENATVVYMTPEMRAGTVSQVRTAGEISELLDAAKNSAIEAGKYENSIKLSRIDLADGKSSLSRKYALEPGREYYASFEYKGVGENEPKVSLNVVQSMENNHISAVDKRNLYRAEKSESADLKHYWSDKENHVWKFEVPKGYVALLKYAYSIKYNSPHEWKKGFYIDGIADGQLPFTPEEKKKGQKWRRENLHISPYLLSSGVHTFALKRNSWDDIVQFMNPSLILYKSENDSEIFANGEIIDPKKPMDTDFRRNNDMELESGWKRSSGSIKTYDKYSLLSSHSGRICRANDSRRVDIKAEQTSEKGWATSYQVRDIKEEAVKAFLSMYVHNGVEGSIFTHENVYSFSNRNDDDKDFSAGRISALGNVTKNGVMDFHFKTKYGYPSVGGYFLMYPKELEGCKDLCMTPELHNSNYLKGDEIQKNVQIFMPRGAASKEALVTIDFENLKSDGEDGALIRNLQLYYIDESGHKVYAERIHGNSIDEITGFELKNLKAENAKQLRKKAASARVYKKNEKVIYGVKYSDYENDPSGASFWSYEHTPYNDGEEELAEYIADAAGNVHPGKGKVLDKPIERFAKDGKYVVRHWQRDSTGNAAYDKLSKKSEIVFYVQGIAPGNAPWIKSIKTSPSPVKEDEYYALAVEVDDRDKDSLSVLIEVYYNGKLVQKSFKENIAANDKGKYPIVETGLLKDVAKVGHYDVVATVRDKDGAGFDNMGFDVIREMGIAGEVRHTDKWEQIRLKHNAKNPQNQRNENVFYSREKFVLSAKVAGMPKKVDVRIKEYPAYSAQLKKTGNKSVYAGSIFSNALQKQLGKSAGIGTTGQKLSFIFTAHYSGGITKKHEVVIFVKDEIREGRLHRLY